MMAAADHPELIGKVVLEDSGPFDMPNLDFSDPAVRQRMSDEMMALAAKSREEIIAIGHEQSPTWSDEELGPWADSKRQARPETFTRLDNPTGDWHSAFPRFQCPVLIIRSDRDKGSMISAESAAEAAAMNPLVQVVHVPGAGHNIRRENFDGYIKAVKAFLAE